MEGVELSVDYVHWKEPVVGDREFGLSVDEKRDIMRDRKMLMVDAGDRVVVADRL